VIVGVDVGGTFTDVVTITPAGIVTAKVPTTTDQSEAVLAGLERVVPNGRVRLVHGTTVATNALLEGTVARTALITDAGFEDVIEIGRQDRPSLYDPDADRPVPLVDRPHRIGWPSETLPAPDVEAVAICLLRSYEDPAEEREIARRLRVHRTDLAVSLSSEVSPEFREYERTSTTVLNAALVPPTGTYLRHLDDRLAHRVSSLTVMRSSGGLLTAAEAAGLPVAILLSGPAGGAVAAAAYGTLTGRDMIVSFDMGGTSTDVCRIEGGHPEIAYERPVAGYPCRMPSIAVHTVGAGGGSEAWIDAGGALRVGPRSAGSDPGPACYDKGGVNATVTDADLVLGRIGPDARLGGRLRISRPRAVAALSRLADRLGLDVIDVAAGIVSVVEEHMAGAIRTVSIEQGADPRDATLVAFGGAGGLHAGALARRLEMDAVLVPPVGGVFSALGLLLSPPRRDVARTVLLPAARAREVAPALRAVAEEAARRLRSATGDEPSVVTRVDVRYVGQSHELTVPCAPDDPWETIARRFHELHTVRNGFARPEDPIEVVTVRAEATGVPPISFDDLPPWQPAGEPRRGTRDVHTGSGPAHATVWWRPALPAGAAIDGPAVVEEPEATTWIGPGERCRVDAFGGLEITW